MSSDAKEIVQKIESKRFTATLVLKAFIRAAIKTSKLSNPITEVLFAPALERARELDGSFLKTGKLVGPRTYLSLILLVSWRSPCMQLIHSAVHGIPISLKDQINVEGFDSSIGFSAQCNQVATSNSTIYEVLVAAGGNPFVKSTVPQTLLSFESSNKVFGTCTNPYDATRTPGGSSSGEGCLLLTSGSALGIGSDVSFFLYHSSFQ